eukprot:scaffold9839_cov157-Skeletonema_marinoi.AAC.7
MTPLEWSINGVASSSPTVEGVAAHDAPSSGSSSATSCMLMDDDSVDRLSSGGSSRPWSISSGNDDGQD